MGIPENPVSARILVVDDYPAVRAVTAKLLTNVGYVVECAASGEEALLAVTRCNDGFDVLLTDLVMPPGMWGDELAKQARAHLPSLRVVIMSSQPDRLRGRPHLDWRNIEVLRKPFHTADLILAMQAVLTWDPATTVVHTGESRP